MSMRDPIAPQRAGTAVTTFADRATPLVRNCWYIAALSTEGGRTLMDRTILGESMLLYRQQDGTPKAMQNRCPHRGMPLSKGRLKGDTVICGYHGFNYDSHGKCILVPSLGLEAKIPTTLQLRSFPVIEHAPFVWIWMGESDKADPALRPALPLFDDPAYRHIQGYFHTHTNYVPMHENVLDLTHAHFLHGEEVASLGFTQAPPEITVDKGTVRVVRKESGGTAPPHYAAAAGIADHKVERISDTLWASLAIIIGFATIRDLEPALGQLRSEFHFQILHAFTPETQRTSRYFWSNGRDSRIDDAEFSARGYERAMKVYHEDVEALGWIQKLYEQTPPGDYAEVSVLADRVGLQMRRLVAQLATAERERDSEESS